MKFERGVVLFDVFVFDYVFVYDVFYVFGSWVWFGYEFYFGNGNDVVIMWFDWGVVYWVNLFCSFCFFDYIGLLFICDLLGDWLV